MAILFEQAAIGGLSMPNRFVRSATWAGMATPEGDPTEGLNGLMERLAQGKVGLIVTGNAFVHPKGQSVPWQLSLADDGKIKGLERMVERMHAHGSRTCCQLVHAGAQTRAELLGEIPKGPSPHTNIFGEETGAMTKADIETVVESFAQAAARAREAGFDAVQLHAAHGYLISQFLSPYFNKREDEYGGSPVNRARLLMEVYRAAREAVGPAFPLLIKINCRDFLEPEFTAGEMRAVCKRLETEGLDAVEISGGTPFSLPNTPTRKGKAGREREAWHLEYAREFRKECGLPVILVGGIRSHAMAEKVVADGDADFISMCRPLIREPHLVKRWREGGREDAKCISCNMCFKGVVGGKGLYCLVDAGEVGQKEAMNE